jgi:DNA-binding transcriptional LysR family regulator
MNLEYLKTFLEVKRIGSFSEVAKRLGISQPAVSFQIGKLERELGVRLFERSHAGISLTPAGTRLVAFAEATEKSVAVLERDIETLREDVVGDLAIGASTIPGEYILPVRLADFKARHPAVRIVVNVADSRKVVAGVRQGRYAVGFCGMPPNEPDLESFPFAADEIVLVAGARHSMATVRHVSFEALEGEPFISRAETSGTQDSLKKLVSQAGYDTRSWQTSMVLGSTQAVISAVESGAGIAFVSNLALERSLAAGTLKRIRVDGVDLARRFYCVYRRDSLTSRLMTEFVDFIRQATPD